MTTTMIKSTSHRLGRTVANAHRYFNRFEARVAGRFSFAGGLSVRIVFWTIRIVVVLALVLAFLIFILPLLPVFWLAKRMADAPWTDEDHDRLQRRLLEQQRLEEEKRFRELEENDWRWGNYSMHDDEFCGELPRMDLIR